MQAERFLNEELLTSSFSFLFPLRFTPKHLARFSDIEISLFWEET